MPASPTNRPCSFHYHLDSWAYIKSKDLQNPGNKREILCDDNLKAVFQGQCVGWVIGAGWREGEAHELWLTHHLTLNA